MRRTPRECVDWNKYKQKEQQEALEVALLVSAWIEIHIIIYWEVCFFGRTPRECVDWNI